MGHHNSHIYNDTDKPVMVVLENNNKRATDQIVEPKGWVCIPTEKGQVTVSAYEQLGNSGNFSETAACTYTDDSDRSFIVKKSTIGRLTLVRSKYGHIKEEEKTYR